MVKKIKETDSTYILKLVLYLILGFFWVWFTTDSGTVQLVLPVGFLIGIFFARQERFQIDRKIEYAVLLVSALVGFLFGSGIYF